MSLEVHIEKKLNGFTLRSDFTAKWFCNFS